MNLSCRERFGADPAASRSVHPRTNEKMMMRNNGIPMKRLLVALREFRDALKWRWTKRAYDKCERIEDMRVYMTYVESIEPKRWQKFALRLLSRLRDAPGGNPNRCPVTGARYALPLEVRQAFTKVESPTLETVRVLAKIERTFGITVEEVQLPTD